MTAAPESVWNALSQAADDLTLSGKSRELFFVKMMEREIASLQKEKEKEIAVLEKEKEIAVLEKDTEIAVLKFKLEFKSKFENELAWATEAAAQPKGCKARQPWEREAALEQALEEKAMQAKQLELKEAKLQQREAALLQQEVC